MRNDITVTFFSNFLLHHQTPFCEVMVKLIGNNFHFVATTPIPQERIDMGYHDYRNEPYAVNSYMDEKSYAYAMELGEKSDVVIIGSAPDIFVEERLKQDKLTFRYYERFFKQGKWRILDPRVLFSLYKMHIRYRKKNLFMLCASAYTALDCRFIFSYPNKTFKWGYFIQVKEQSFEELLQKKNDKQIKILWVSRFIKLKHPEEVIKLAQKLSADGIDFCIEMIGIGELREKYETIVEHLGLNEKVIFKGPMSPEEVIDEMETADIFLFTSDRQEGWGAVLNEAMTSGCAVVACNEIGSVPYLIEDGVNGFVYNKKEKDSLYQKVRQLIDNKELRRNIQFEAYQTMHNVWNAEVAAERLINLIDGIKEGKEAGYKKGPCSRDK